MKSRLGTLFLSLFLSLFLVQIPSLTLAQSGGTLILPPGPYNGGETISIGYINPAKANLTITVTIKDPDPLSTHSAQEVQITLDADGQGSAHWKVPTDWEVCCINAPDAEPVCEPIK